MTTGAEVTSWRVARWTLAVVATLAVCNLVYLSRGALVLVFLGTFVAISVEPLISALVARNWRRGGAVLLMVAVAALLVGLGVVTLMIPAAHQVALLVLELPERLASLSAQLGGSGTAAGSYAASPDTADAYQDGLSQTVALLGSSAAGIFAFLGSVAGATLSAFCIAAVAVYVALAMPRLRAAADTAVGSAEWSEALEESLAKVSGYVLGQGLICVMAGAFAYLYFQLAGVPYPALLALIVLVLDAIPQVGATLAAVVGVAVALSVSVPLAVATLVYFLIYQQLENYLVAPRVFARTIAISPLAAFIAVLIGGSVAGVLGAVLSLPVTGAGAVIFRHLRAQRAQRPPAGQEAATGSAS